MDAHLNADGPHLLANAERHYRGGPTVEARFEIPRPGFSVTVLFGPSGSGKTTALRLLAGLERADRGSIHFGGVPWSEAAKGLHRTHPSGDLRLELFVPEAQLLDFGPAGPANGSPAGRSSRGRGGRRGPR